MIKKIGIISDTHDNLIMIKKAVEYFNNSGVEMVLHSGDFVAPFALNPFEYLRCKGVGVFGNVDGERRGLMKKAFSLGWEINIPPCEFKIDKKRILILHESDDLQRYISSGSYDLIVYGHTHRLDIQREGNTLIINPGECCGWLYGKGTVVVLDLTDMEAERVTLE
ncbi:MAG: metallophosphoesterase [Nitrospinae bacterium]|nr:metallophosphoesterase [Nitrospinota bacterium]